MTFKNKYANFRKFKENLWESLRIFEKNLARCLDHKFRWKNPPLRAMAVKVNRFPPQIDDLRRINTFFLLKKNPKESQIISSTCFSIFLFLHLILNCDKLRPPPSSLVVVIETFQTNSRFWPTRPIKINKLKNELCWGNIVLHSQSSLMAVSN